MGSRRVIDIRTAEEREADARLALGVLVRRARQRPNVRLDEHAVKIAKQALRSGSIW